MTRRPSKRSRETPPRTWTAAAADPVVLPLTFLSASFLPLTLAPDWIQSFATFNPVNWAAEAGREALLANPDWSMIVPRLGALLLVAIVCAWMATGAFRSYQRSV